MSSPDDVDDASNWTGGFYELLLVLGAPDDTRFDRAVRSLWRAAGARLGPGEPTPGGGALETAGHLRGSLTLPSGDRVVCGLYAFRNESADSLELYLPLGALCQVEERIGAYPFDDRSGPESLTWRDPLDRWLATVATRVHSDVPFEHAVIGFEIDDTPSPTATKRWSALLQPHPNGLHFHPATT